MQDIPLEQYILMNADSRNRLAQLINSLGIQVSPDDPEGLLMSMAQLTTQYGREFVYNVMAHAHPDKEIIIESVQHVSAKNELDRYINKGLTEFTAMSPWIKAPVLGLVIVLLVRAIMGRV